MHKDTTKLFFFISCASFLATIGVLLFVLHIIANKNEHTSAVLNTLSNKTIEKQNSDLLTKKIADVTLARSSIDEYLVDPSRVDVLVEYLENLGTETHTETLVKGAEVSTTVKNTLMIKVSIKGMFVDVMQMIARLESSPYQIHITSAYLNQETNPTGPDGKPIKLSSKPRVWQADITFSILASS